MTIDDKTKKINSDPMTAYEDLLSLSGMVETDFVAKYHAEANEFLNKGWTRDEKYFIPVSTRFNEQHNYMWIAAADGFVPKDLKQK